MKLTELLKKEGINIKNLKKKDVKEVAPLMLNLYKKWDKIDQLDKIDEEWFCSDKHYNYLERIMDDKNQLFLVAKTNKEIVAYLLAEIEERKPFLQKVGYIAEVYTIPEYRGKSIAPALIKRTYNWFKKNNLKSFIVGTHVLDQKAISFWQDQGFKEFNKIFKKI